MKIRELLEQMNIDIERLTIRERQILAQDLARKIRFNKKETYKLLKHI